MITLSALFFAANAQTLNAFSTQNITYQSADASFFLNPNCANGATFNVEYSTNAGFSPFTNAGGGSVANVGFTRVVNLAALQPSTLYYWRVRVQLGTNCSSTPIISATQSFSTLAAPTPSVPSITSIGSTVSSNSATISYVLNANLGATTSLINYGLSSGNLSSQVTGASASGSAATPANTNIIGLTPQTVYYYQIVATNSVGTTSSSVLSFTTSAVFVPQIIAEYDFDNTYNNILGGNPFTANAGTSFVTGRNGITNGALNINSTGSTATITGLPYGNSPRTITFWAKVNVMRSDYNMTFRYGQFSNSNAMGGSFKGDNAMFLGYNNNLTVANSNVAGTWYYFTYTYDGTTAKIYKNGVLAGSGAYAWNTLNNSAMFSLGTGVGGELWFNGAIDELKIYNYAISATEVGYLYNDSPCAGVGVNAPTNTTAAQNLTICSGQSATLTATANGVIDWTGAGTGTGPIFVTPTLTANTTFTITNTETGCASEPTVLTVSVSAIPFTPMFTGPASISICSGNTASLTAASTGTISWFASPTGTTALTTGTVYTTPILTNNTSYYISTTSNGCESARAVKTVTVKPIPTAPVDATVSQGGSLNICSGQSTTLFNLNYVNWYTLPTGGSIVNSGTQFSTPSLTTNTTYYIEYNPNGCPSSLTAITVTVSTCTDIMKAQELSSISLQPNPASTYFNLNNVIEGTSVNVIDVTGKVVISSSVIETDKTMTFETSNLSNGIYIIQLKNNGAVAQKKLVISK